MNLTSKVNAELEKIRNRYDKFQDMTKNVDSSSNPEFREMRKGKYYIVS